MSTGLEAGTAQPRWRATTRAGKIASRPWARAAFVALLFGLGLFEGYRLSSPQTSPVAYEAGSLVAAGELESALYDPAAVARDAGPTAGEPFTNSDGESCRRFTDGGVEGMACQRAGDWRVVEMRQD